VAGFNLSSAAGRLLCGFLCDAIGPLNTLFMSLVLSAGSMLVLWPISNSLGPLVAFVVINGAANGGFFSCMPTVVGEVFGSARVSVAMGMIVTGWVGGYLLVSGLVSAIRPLTTTDYSRELQLLVLCWTRTEGSTGGWMLIILPFSMLDPWLLLLLVWWHLCVCSRERAYCRECRVGC
jgi:MFS family permease